MADLAITEVGITAATQFARALVGQAGVPGDVLYLDTSSGNKWKQAVADGTEEQAGKDGLAIQLTFTEADGDFALIALDGNLRMAADVGYGEGTTYVVSETAGKIAEDGDIGSGSYKSIIGVGGTEGASSNDLSLFVLNPLATGQQVP